MVFVHIARGAGVMRIRQSLLACVTALVASISASYAGPCSQEIDRVQADIDAKLNSNAANGPSASESTAATKHRQPTPESIATAESQLGEISPEQIQAVTAAMERAHEADGAGDESACWKALADVQRIRGQ
jgi:hypothetical protein